MSDSNCWNPQAEWIRWGVRIRATESSTQNDQMRKNADHSKLNVSHVGEFSSLFDSISASADWSVLESNGLRTDEAHSTFERNEKRQSDRIALRKQALLTASSDADSPSSQWTGILMRDFSMEGCGFYSPIRLEIEERHIIRMPESWLEILPRRCVRVDEACFDIGAVVTRWVSSAFGDQANLN